MSRRTSGSIPSKSRFWANKRKVSRGSSVGIALKKARPMPELSFPPSFQRKTVAVAQEQLCQNPGVRVATSSGASHRMSTELEPDLQLEIAHVLFIDVVGYSKLLIKEQHQRLGELNQIVRNTDAFRVPESAGKLIWLPTGDGMALAFSTSPDAPVRCALQI